MAKTKNLLGKDIVPFEGGDLILIPVGADGKETTARRTYGGYLISVTPTTARTEEEVEKGTGANATLPSTEAQSWAIVTNSKNDEFDATIEGKEYKVEAGIMLNEMVTPITKAGEAGSETYTYTFVDENKPVKDENGIAVLSVVDQDGYSLVDASGQSEAVAEGQFKFDFDTSVLSVSSAYEGETLTVLFYKQETEISIISAPDTLISQTFRAIAISKLQSVKGGYKARRVMEIDRCNITGDIGGTPNQKGLNVNKSYTLTSQDPRAGKKRYTDKTAII